MTFVQGVPLILALSIGLITAIGFAGFAVSDDAGTVRATWDWFAVAASLGLIIATVLAYRFVPLA